MKCRVNRVNECLFCELRLWRGDSKVITSPFAIFTKNDLLNFRIYVSIVGFLMGHRKTMSYSVLLNMWTGIIRSHDLSEDKQTLKLSLESQNQRWRTTRTVLWKRCTCELIVPTIPQEAGLLQQKQKKKKKNSTQNVESGRESNLDSAALYKVKQYFSPIFSPKNCNIRPALEESCYGTNYVIPKIHMLKY